MARSTFGGGISDFVFAPFSFLDRRLISLASTTLTMWSAQTGGVQYDDLLLEGESTSVIPVGPDGQIPEFEGPDGVFGMWASAGGARVFIYAQALPEITARLNELTAAVSALQQGGGTVPVGNTVPTPVRDLLTVPTSSAITATWSVPESNGGAAITGYRVTLTLNGAVVGTPVTVTARTHTFTGLTAGTAYQLSVVALNGVATGSVAATVPVTTLSSSTTPAADKPTATVTAVTSTGATLDWAYPTTPAQTIGAVRFGWDTTSTGGASQSWVSSDFATPADPFVFTNLAADTTYGLYAEMVYAGSGGTPTTPLVGPIAFTGTNGAAPPANAAAGFPTDGSRKAIQGNKMRLTAGTVGGYSAADRVMVVWADDAGTKLSRSNIDITHTLLTPSGDGTALIFTNCVSSTDTGQTAYSVDLHAGTNPAINRASSFTYSTLATAASFTPVAGTAYNVRMRVYNGLIQVWIWAIGGTQPTSPTMSVTDSSPLAAGYAGVGLNFFGTTEVDDLTISDGAATGGGSVGTTGPRVTVTAKTNPAVVNPPATAGGLPSGRLAGLYKFKWNAVDLPTIASKGPDAYNYVYEFVAQSAAAGTGRVQWDPGNGDAAYATQRATWDAAGKKRILSIDGAGGGVKITNSTQVAEFLSSVKPIIDKYGLHGIDWDIESNNAIDAMLVSASVDLKNTYGGNFIISMVPRPWEPGSGQTWNPFAVARTLQGTTIDGKSCLDLFGMQFYDSPEYADVNIGWDFIRNYVAKAVTTYGIPASKVVLGFAGEGYGAGKGGVTAAEAVDYFNRIKGIYPTIRGIFVYDTGVEADLNSWRMTTAAQQVRAS